MMQRLWLYGRLVRLDKPIGILLLLWPTLWGLFIAAEGWPSLKLFVIFVLGTVLMRSAGCAMNDYFDRDVDRHVKRTEQRVLTSGQIQSHEALWVAAVLGLLSLALVWSLNGLTLVLAVVAAVLAVTYPLFKRFFAIPQAYLGIAFGFGIPMGFAATVGSVPTVAWLMLLANIFWAIAYDTEYAMVDRDDDIRLGLKTSAITFGKYDIFCVALCYLMTLLLLGGVGYLLSYGWPYAVGLLASAGLAALHLVWIRQRTREGCFRAFLHNTWIGFAVFCGIFAQTIIFS
ncbi:MAG: 4-hydroxybenzoate octaprenyltransferase [Alcaligenaceae bacterium]